MLKPIIAIIVFLTVSDCFSQIIKWQEIFDSVNVTDRGWRIVNNDSSAVNPELFGPFSFLGIVEQNPHAGNYFWKLSFENVNAHGLVDDWLITPKLLNIETGDSISFWCGAIDKQYKDSLRILISTTDNQLSSFHVIDYFKADGPPGAWHKKSHDLSKYSGGYIYFAVNYHLKAAEPLGPGGDQVWIDHFTHTGKSTLIVTSYELSQNFPNPFNPETNIAFSVPQNSNVTIKIYNTLGKEVATLVDGFYQMGRYNISLNGINFASGVYFYTMTAGSFSDTKKMEIVK